VTFQVDTREMSLFVLKLELAAKRVSPAARGVSQKYGALVVKEARRLVPVDTGFLRDSIHVEMSSDGSTGIANVVADAEYAGFVEFGTRYQSPQPYLRPALKKYRKPYTKELAEVGAQLIGGTKAQGRKLLTGSSLATGRVRRFSRSSA
jgi:HK97 gp10 family phage protein